jgi:hypothetical protein
MSNTVMFFTFDGGPRTSLEDMLAENAHDDCVCEWLRSAQEGDTFMGCDCLGTVNPTADTLTDDVGPTHESVAWPNPMDDFNYPGSRHHY